MKDQVEKLIRGEEDDSLREVVVGSNRRTKSYKEEEVVSGRTEKLLQHRPYRVLNEE